MPRIEIDDALLDGIRKKAQNHVRMVKGANVDESVSNTQLVTIALNAALNENHGGWEESLKTLIA